jgi:hypothetical protein
MKNQTRFGIVWQLKLMILFGALLLSGSTATAIENDPLDAGFSDLVHPVSKARVNQPSGSSKYGALFFIPPHADPGPILNRLPPIRSQGGRSTCSIFSGVGMLEAMLVLKKGIDPSALNLSEEWLQYMVSTTTREHASTSKKNFRLFASYGVPKESDWVYDEELWDDLTGSKGLARTRCGHLNGPYLDACLLGHRDPRLLSSSDSSLSTPGSGKYDPDFLNYRNHAKSFRDQYLHGMEGYIGADPSYTSYLVPTIEEAKSLLAQSTPINVDLDFYYGAWNHGSAVDLGIGQDESAYFKGNVGYPEQGSVDRDVSTRNRVGHSIVLIGYNDELEISYSLKMKNGQWQNFKRRGVYYFRNAWGTKGFGKNFQYNGTLFPGYGMIAQDYIHEFGALYQFPLK